MRLRWSLDWLVLGCSFVALLWIAQEAIAAAGGQCPTTTTGAACTPSCTGNTCTTEQGSGTCTRISWQGGELPVVAEHWIYKDPPGIFNPPYWESQGYEELPETATLSKCACVVPPSEELPNGYAVINFSCCDLLLVDGGGGWLMYTTGGCLACDPPEPGPCHPVGDPPGACEPSCGE